MVRKNLQVYIRNFQSELANSRTDLASTSKHNVSGLHEVGPSYGYFILTRKILTRKFLQITCKITTYVSTFLQIVVGPTS